jgi:FKBP-type peptidyl-prolyl cis-trans isomerase SlyD
MAKQETGSSSSPTSIGKDCVVSIHYTLRGDDTQVIDTSDGSDPLVYLHGHGQIISGLEGKLTGRAIGDSLQVEVAPSDGYGEYDDSLVVNLEKGQFPKGAKVEIGTMFELASNEGGSLVVRVISVDGTSVQVDGNHPLAGKRLFFDVSVVGIRAATKEELEHGHAHGPGGHHH